jgi:D-alanyl-lipoteichoic acid acyltransferase DltB (MBOAT superfamily)
MIFNSSDFIIFFALVYAAYIRLQSPRQQNWLLLGASYIFYGWAAPRYVALLIFYTAATFVVGIKIDDSSRPGARKAWLAAGVLINLGVLGYFKYFGFFASEVSAALAKLGLMADQITLKIFLPIGISFFTFQSMAYLIDVYRGVCRAMRDPLTFAVFKAFFPQLVAGPIERANNMMPQIERARTITGNDVAQGIYWALLGYFLKSVVADRVAPLAAYNFLILPDAAFNRGPVSALCGIWAFGLQIYGDFAGYTYIALGVARLMGIQLQRNFLGPYLATSIQEFWRRWNVTLSFWLRDYLYIPLGGSRRGALRTYANLLVVMTLGGLWHGANWTFMIWGLYHGCGLAVHRALSPYLQKTVPDFVRNAGGWIITLIFVMVGWSLFRAGSPAEFTDIWRRVLTPGPVSQMDMQAVGVLSLLSMIVLIVQRVEEYDPSHAPRFGEIAQPYRLAVCGALFLSVLAVGLSENRFIYFQF